MIVVRGVRRIGKSSLIRVTLNTSGPRLRLVLDARALPVLSADAVYDLIAEALRRLLEESRGLRGLLGSMLSRIDGVEVSGFSVAIQQRKPGVLQRLAQALSQAARELGEPAVLVFDEAQDFRIVPGFTRVLAHIYDYVDNVKLLLAGSEVGLLDRLLGKGNPEAPLYGRPYLEIAMPRLSRSQSVDFLERGFAELGLEWPSSYIEEAVDMLDGIPGWLTAYGYHAYTTRDHRAALSRVTQEGAALAARELEAFLQPRAPARRRYILILECLAARPMRWAVLKRCLEASLGRRLNNAQFTRYLHELEAYSFVEKRGEEYMLADPLLSEAVRLLPR